MADYGVNRGASRSAAVMSKVDEITSGRPSKPMWQRAGFESAEAYEAASAANQAEKARHSHETVNESKIVRR